MALHRPGRRAGAGRLGAAVALLALICAPAAAQPPAAGDEPTEAGRRIYMEGLLPSGTAIEGIALGDVALDGAQVTCAGCHRRSGLGSMEGQEAVPAITGDILFAPLRLPTSGPPLAPLLRPAYTAESLRVAIRDGIGADGQALSPLMPRYRLGEGDLDALVAYLGTLESSPAPGVTERDMHLATVVGGGVAAARRKAFLDVMEQFVAQRNRETRHESERAANAPWHKAWRFKPYRKWVLHVWELTGPEAGWPEQLRRAHERQPVFAVVSGVVAEGFGAVHAFCEGERVPCIFPITDLPLAGEGDFYTIYFDRGMALEADAVAEHLAAEGLTGLPVTQVRAAGDPRGAAAAARLRQRVEQRGGTVVDVDLPAAAPGGAGAAWPSAGAGSGVLVLWLDQPGLDRAWSVLGEMAAPPERVYLSAALRGSGEAGIAPELRSRVRLVHRDEPPGPARQRLLARASGWLRARGIADPGQDLVQGNALFALKAAGEAAKGLRGFFNREHFIERIEHMIDNATYTSVYPTLTLSPGQRFVSKGTRITRFDGAGGLAAVTDWLPVHPGGEPGP